MWEIKKKVVISASHHLYNYQGKCKNIHGHNWTVQVYCKGDELNHQSMLVDFGEIKQVLTDLFDHKDINEVVNYNPTAERIAEHICDLIPFCYKVELEEQEGSLCTYVKD